MGFSRQEYWSGVPLPSLRQTIKTLKHNFRLELAGELLAATLVRAGREGLSKTETLSRPGAFKSLTYSFAPGKEFIPAPLFAG